MFRDYFLRWRNHQLLKSDRTARTFVAYREAKDIGVLFSDQFSTESIALNRFIGQLQSDGKRVRALTYFERAHSYPYDFAFDYFVKKEINFLGVIGSEKVEQFIDYPFDYLFCLNTIPFLPFDQILLRSRARYRMGLYQPGRETVLEVMVKSGGHDSLTDLVEQLYKYTQQLLPNEP